MTRSCRLLRTQGLQLPTHKQVTWTLQLLGQGGVPG